MNAILVSVDYTDILSLTLPYNRHHFGKVTVVTSPEDYANVRPVAEKADAQVFVTNAFYRNGAKFNKFAALEEGIDFSGRHGWVCIMDADIIWPKVEPKWDGVCGCLYTPRRRVANPCPKTIPPEETWRAYPDIQRHKEFAGYTQIFHSDDPALGCPPWHQLDWRHAGGADSFFQAKWSEDRKIRPPFEVLHLGPVGENWCGRASPYADGTLPKEATLRRGELRRFLEGRIRAVRGGSEDPYRGEKLPK